MKRILGLSLVVTLAISCNQTGAGTQKERGELKVGPWIFELQGKGAVIPFTADISTGDSSYVLVVRNARERIKVDAEVIAEDSLIFTMPFFHSELHCTLVDSTEIRGYWTDINRGKDYKLEMWARFDEGSVRFHMPSSTDNFNFSGKWHVTFSPATDDEESAIGLFNQNEDRVTGTFITETGDYRFLEGNASGDSMKLSCFDGSHAFVFHCVNTSDSTLTGEFWSGNHYHTNWTGKKDMNYQLSHPDSLTTYDDSNSVFDLSFIDTKGHPFLLSKAGLEGKVVIIQILGSWCPNCADESHLFSLLYDRYKNEGLDIIGVSYEKMKKLDDALKQIEYFKESLGAPYPILYGGRASKLDASEDFYMLSGISSFPTAIFIDRKGKIRKIHTGFYGPGTGDYHERYKKELNDFIQELLDET